MFAAILILLHAYALSLEVFAITLVVFAVMFLLFFSTAPKFGYVLILTPLAFVFKIPYFVPLAMGLVSTPVTAIPVACGTVVYFLLHYLGMNTAMLSSAQNSTVTEKITYLLDNVLNNKEMILTVVAFTLTIVIVYMIRRMSVDHAWTIAVVAGAVADAIVLLTGSLILGVSPKLLSVIVGGILSAVLALLLQISIFSLDYSRTEYVQFEDDEYYYYVKAVPKISIAVPQKKVKKINAQKAPQRKVSSGRKKSARRDTSKLAGGREDVKKCRVLCGTISINMWRSTPSTGMIYWILLSCLSCSMKSWCGSRRPAHGYF